MPKAKKKISPKPKRTRVGRIDAAVSRAQTGKRKKQLPVKKKS